MINLFTPAEFAEFVDKYRNCSSGALRRIYQNEVLDCIDKIKKTKGRFSMYIAGVLYEGTLKWDVRYFKSFKWYNSKWWGITQYWSRLLYKISRWYYILLLAYLDKHLGDNGLICCKLDALMTVTIGKMFFELELPYRNPTYNYTNGRDIKV